MAIRPVVNSLRANATSAGIINNVRKSGYIAGAPEAKDTAESIAQLGTYINAYQSRRNEFVNALTNLIGLQKVYIEEYQAPWGRFLQGTLESGESIEEVVVNPARAEHYNAVFPTVDDYLKDRFGNRTADILAAMHSVNFKFKYTRTLQLQELTNAFRSRNGVASLIDAMTVSQSTGMKHDNYLMLKYVLGKLTIDGKIENITVAGVDTEAHTKETMKKIKERSEILTFLESGHTLSRDYLTQTPIKKQVDIITPAVDAAASVDVLAFAFNKSEAEFVGDKLLMNPWNAEDLSRLSAILTPEGAAEPVVPFTSDELAILNTVVCYIVDEKFLMQVDKLVEMISEPIASNNLSWNVALHHHAYFGASMFKNANVLTTSTGSITSVTVSPATATMAAGSSLQLEATIVSSGIIDQDVKWTCTEGATIDSFGRITIDADATSASTITVTATSVADSTKAGTATITVA